MHSHFYSSASLPSIFSSRKIFTSVQIHTVCENILHVDEKAWKPPKIEPTLNHCCREVTRHSAPLPHPPRLAQHALVPSLNYIRRDSAARSSIFLRPGKLLVHSKVNHVRLALAAPPWLANRECKVDALSASIGLKLFSTIFFLRNSSRFTWSLVDERDASWWQIPQWDTDGGNLIFITASAASLSPGLWHHHKLWRISECVMCVHTSMTSRPLATAVTVCSGVWKNGSFTFFFSLATFYATAIKWFTTFKYASEIHTLYIHTHQTFHWGHLIFSQGVEDHWPLWNDRSNWV